MTLMENLLQLFHVDAQVRGLRSRLDSAQRYLDAQTRQLNQLSEQHDEFESRKKQAQATIANLETEVQVIDERIEKLRDELNSASTNKQYAAVLKELNGIKESRGEIEERILQEMGTVESLEGQLEELKGQVAEREKVRDVARQQLDQRQSEIGERLSELETERTAAAASVPDEHLAVFEEMSIVCEGESMAQVDEIDRRARDYACGACHMTVPFEQVALLAGGNEILVRCTACGRILFMQDDTRGALAKK